jgi:hypothetical protein
MLNRMVRGYGLCRTKLEITKSLALVHFPATPMQGKEGKEVMVRYEGRP